MCGIMTAADLGRMLAALVACASQYARASVRNTHREGEVTLIGYGTRGRGLKVKASSLEESAS